MELTELKGVGPKTSELFTKLGIHSAEELLWYFPNTYLEYPKPVHAGELRVGEMESVSGLLERDASVIRVNGRIMTNLTIRDLTGRVRLTWFNAPFLKGRLHAGAVLIFYGKVSSYNGMKTMSQPRIFSPEEYSRIQGTLEPVYGQTKGLSNKLVIRAVRSAFEKVGVSAVPRDFLPELIRSNRKLPPLYETVLHLHFPESAEDYRLHRRRIAYDELFLFSLALQQKKNSLAKTKSGYRITPQPETETLLRTLPYVLTEGQKRALSEIREDLSSGTVMNRLLEGDVGSGKTIVAFAALLDTALCGFQAALMAPTEILARQHYQKLEQILREHNLPLRVVFVSGSLTKKERAEVTDKIRTHGADIVIGTHALFQKDLQYDCLALVITDEQHRFGVNQRQDLSDKGNNPHILAMSATPIPRTLAMLLYADMKVSRILDKPSERLPIRNAVVNEGYRENAWRFLYREVSAGRQGYVICPMIEENDTVQLENVTDYAEKLRAKMPKRVRIAILNGQMKAADRDEVMDRFQRHEIDILVSTTVVEVGVDVPNATVMVIENAERFGLAQLHQLRGRIGRSGLQSYCIFIDTEQSEKSKKRLSVLGSSNDGFYIAEEDLKLRGPGDIFGIRQSGALAFSMADIYSDRDTLAEASEDAAFLMKQDPELSLPEDGPLRERLAAYVEKSMTL